MVKAIARRLGVAHPSVGARAVRDALAEPAPPSQPAQRAEPAAAASSSMDQVTPGATQAPLKPTVAEEEEGPTTRFRRVKLAWPEAMMGQDRMGLDGLHAIVGGREAGAPGLPPAEKGLRGVRLLEAHPMQSHIMQMSEKYMETVAYPERPCFGALHRGEPLMSIESRVNSTTEGLSGYAEHRCTRRSGVARTLASRVLVSVVGRVDVVGPCQVVSSSVVLSSRCQDLSKEPSRSA